MKVYYTKDGLHDRIKEIRLLKDVFTEREQELTILYNALTGTKNCVVDNNGKVLKIGSVKKQSNYELTKARDSFLKTYMEKGIIVKRLEQKRVL